MEKSTNQNYGKNHDFEDQDTMIDIDTNYVKDEDQYQYQEEFIDINHQTNDFNRNENIPNEERIINEDDLITNDEEREESDDEVDYDEDLEKDGDLDNVNDDEEDLEEYDPFYPEKHPRE